MDDLDRCAPAAVVKVLEAVHLLLSYEIFVVVVAVDAQWVSKSLSTVYPTLLGDSTFTPDQYLEKIFQLPVWLDGMSPEAAATMARRLLKPEPSPAAPAVAAAAGEVAAGTDSSATRTPVTGTASAGPGRRSDLATSAPESVRIDDDEALGIEQLAPLLTRSPRALKRYLNTYRLLKAFVDQEHLATARILLAITTGRPQLGEELLLRIVQAPEATTVGELVAAWSDADQAWLGRAEVGDDWRGTSCVALRPVVADVRRFVFRSSRAPAGRHGR